MVHTLAAGRATWATWAGRAAWAGPEAPASRQLAGLVGLAGRADLGSKRMWSWWFRLDYGGSGWKRGWLARFPSIVDGVWRQRSLRRC